MWIGRETYDAEELDEAIDTAKAEATAPTEDYLMGVPMLADYLEDGLNALDISLEEAEDGVLRLT
jgi:molecular chaperone GrpE (heat shock protein)